MIIVGLGNPGKQYENTYHNMGYGVLDALGGLLSERIIKAEADSLTAVTQINGQKLILAKPITYMNLSGNAVKSLLGKYGQDQELIVCYDDIDLPRFALRIRTKGSAGTHNGMRNIVQTIGRTDFLRVRIGIGREDYELKDYVLSKPCKEDMQKFSDLHKRAAELLLRYVQDGVVNKLMRDGNTSE